MHRRDALLEPAEKAKCRDLGERLRSALRSLIDALPPEARSVRLTAELLALDRNLIQRAFRASRMDLVSQFVLVEAPGVEGMRKVLRAARRAGLDEGATAGLEAATNQYESLIAELAGSQQALNRRIKAGNTQAPADPTFAAREARFFADAEIFGASQDVRHGVFLFRPKPGQPELLEHANASGRFGLQRKADGLPVCGYYKLSKPPDQGETSPVRALKGASMHGTAPSLIIPEFTNGPIPTVTGTSEDGIGVHVLESPVLAEGGLLDIFVGRLISPAGKDPRLDGSGRLTQRISMRFPAKALVFDVWLHKDYVAASHPFCGQYVKGADDNRDPRKRWYDRVSGTLQLEELGEGLGRAASPHHPRIAELAKFVFDAVEWDSSDFVGFRYQVQYPLLGVAHVISFEFE